MVRRQVTNALHNGKFEALVYSFPSELCTDDGWAINNADRDWPQTLQGKAKEFYERYQTFGKPAGYKLKAQIITFKDGIPADIGFSSTGIRTRFDRRDSQTAMTDVKEFAGMNFGHVSQPNSQSSGYRNEEVRHNPETKFYSAETQSKNSRIIMASAVAVVDLIQTGKGNDT